MVGRRSGVALKPRAVSARHDGLCLTHCNLRMRLLFLSSTFPDDASPSRGTYNAALCCALAKDHQVHVVAPRTYGEVRAMRRTGRRFQRSPQLAAAGIATDYPTYWHTPKVFRSSYGKQMWWSVRRHVQRILADFRPDAIVSYWAHPDGEAGRLAAGEARVPSAVIVGGSDVLILPFVGGRGRVIRDVLCESSAVITISDGLKRATTALGVPDGQVHTIYQGVDPHVFRPGCQDESRKRLQIPSKGKVILWVGRMVPVKGLDVLIDAFGWLNRQRGDIQLYLVGDGPQRPEIERRTIKSGLNQRVHFVGAVGHDLIGEWYRAADLTVLSSHSEGLPNVLRESLACGTPFVSTDVGSIREIADERYCRLVPPDHPVALGTAMNTMLDPYFRAGVQAYQPRTWQNCAREIAQLLDTEIRRNRAAVVENANSRDLEPLAAATERVPVSIRDSN